MRVDVLDPGADVERVVVLLDPLVGVERLAVAERPLTLTPGPARRPGRAGASGPRSGRGAAGRHAASSVSAVPGHAARGGHPAKRARQRCLERAGAERARDGWSGVVSRPDRSRCARGRNRRGDEPRSGGRLRRSWEASCCHTPWGAGQFRVCRDPTSRADTPVRPAGFTYHSPHQRACGRPPPWNHCPWPAPDRRDNADSSRTVVERAAWELRRLPVWIGRRWSPWR